MERKDEIKGLRIRKTESLKSSATNPYPAKHVLRVLISDVRKKKKGFQAIAGRILSQRGHGGAVFMDIGDQTGTFQLLFRKDVLGAKIFSDVAYLDPGDFVAAQGKVFKTQRGEETLEVKSFTLLSKALLPPPTHFYGLKDVEERFRHRALDLLVNDDVRARFVLRSHIIDSLCEAFQKAGFLQVETPMLQSLPGGASARPFKTHLNALDLDLYLRVAPELYLKRLLVGGFEKIFEIGRCFRNEGMDQTHNPEFTMLEAYWAYQDADGLMKFVETVFANLIKGKPVVFRGKKISFKKPFSKIAFSAAVKKYSGIDISDASDEMVRQEAEAAGADSKVQPTREEQLDAIFKKRCLPNFQNPMFIVEHPLELSPLAKARDKKSEVADRFQLVIGGLEIVNAFSELNDPMEQRARFEAQERARKKGSEEAQRMDEEYIETMEYGMPPAAGLGIGVDRLVMLLTDAPSLREIILFPTMRPK